MPPTTQPAVPGYTGDVDRAGMPHGRGAQQYADGSTYEGEFSHGAIHGHGVFRYKSGATYIGAFEKGRKSRRGRYTFACGTVYDGDYVDDQRSGKGQISFSAAAGATQRQRAVAALQKAGVPSSFVEQLSQMTRYVGSFLKNSMHGPGTLQFASGAVYSGTMADNAEMGKGVLVLYDNSLRIEGDFAGGVLHGKAAVVDLVHGARSVVAFRNGLPVARQCGSPDAKTRVINGQRRAMCELESDAEGRKRCTLCGSPQMDDNAVATWLRDPRAPVEPPPAPTRQPMTEDDIMAALQHSDEPPPAQKPGADAAATRSALRPSSANARRSSNPPSRPQSAQTRSSPPPASAGTADTDASLGIENADTTSTASSDTGDSSSNESFVVQRAAASPPPVRHPRADGEHAQALQALLVAARQKLEAARPGLGMAIADCVRPDHREARHGARSTSPQQARSVSPSRGGTTTGVPCGTVVRVVQLAPQSPAVEAGLARGDYIVALDDRRVATKHDMEQVPLKPGQRASLVVRKRHDGPPPPGDAQQDGCIGVVSVRVGCAVREGDFKWLAGLFDEGLEKPAAATTEADVATLVAWREAVHAVHVAPHPVAW